jgi:hypothetical protein
VISSKINPKFDGLLTCAFLPIAQIHQNFMYIEIRRTSPKVQVSN